ncbi:hypothetical protein F503_05288 [Ophiostoma piceae UAMH 11346]|uniref:Uncharacterized protein n=1 Tax=Ophiostoma piceae (strain UAMH 11346) TaxID=1262450 RepID=S3CU27_OPHP1|nr:hypothetical protein F503_05288 [Ophiostoma piceae UAMH 11346]
MPSGRPSTSGGRRDPSPTEASSLAPLAKPAPLDRRISRDDSFLSSQPRRAATFDSKRMSRDDMFLGNYQSAARRAAFHIPLRNQPATIGEAPDLGPAASLSLPKHIYRSDSFASGEIQIGMALGSPLHPPSSEQVHTFQQHQQVHQYQAPQELFRQIEQSSTHAQESRQQISSTRDNHLSTEFSSSSKPRSTGSAAPTQAPAPTSKPTSPPSSSMQRSKSTRRKLFGFFGSKRQADNVKPAMPPPPVEVGETLSAVKASATAGSSTISQTSQAPIATPATLERSTTRGGNRKYQPIIIPGEPEPSTAANTKANNSMTNTTLIDAPPASSSIGLKSSPSFRGKRPFLRSKASELAIRKRPGISDPIPEALANSSMSSLTSVKAVPAGSTAALAPAAASSHHLMSQNMRGASPYLNVDIPEASMERYSIMFDGLLNSGPSASSLLARRQATLDKLKTINDKMYHDDLERNHANALASDAYLQVGGLQRRATSPHTRSPSFSLFPSKSPNVSHHLNLLSVPSGPRSPRLRSNTSPAATHSPIRSEFDFSKQSSQRNANPLYENPTGLARKVPVVSHMGLAVSTMPSPASAMAARSAIYFDPDQSSLILDSPTEMTSPVNDRQTWKETTEELPVFKPVIHEPQWQMMSPPSAGSNSSSNSNVSNGSASSRLVRNKELNISNSSSPASDMSVELQIDEPDSALKSAVESSIARQISVSRQQREMLRPLKTGNLKGAASSASPALSRSATLKLGRNEWLQETKSATPTVVVPTEVDVNYSYGNNNDERFRSNSQPQRPVRERDDQQSIHYLSPRSNTHGAGSLPTYQLAQNRKSERVVLEAA